MARATNGRERRPIVPRVTLSIVHAAARTDRDDDNIVLDTLRILGVIRKKVDRPAVGRKAYVRWWERLRALIVLAGIVVSLGIALAAVIGITVLGFGFLLEQAIS